MLKRYSWGLKLFNSVEVAVVAKSDAERVKLSVRGKPEHVEALRIFLSFVKGIDGRAIDEQASAQDVLDLFERHPELRAYATHKHPITRPNRVFPAGFVT